MRFTLALSLLLCGSNALMADNGPSVPNDSVCRTDQRFEVAVKGVTGAKIDVRAEVSVGDACSISTADPNGTPVRVDIRIRDGEKGKKHLEVSVVEKPTNGAVRVVSFAALLAGGESTCTGPSWNHLFDIRLSEPRRTASWR
jgi:hypothetical protein